MRYIIITLTFEEIIMKKLFAVLLLAIAAVPAFAGPERHGSRLVVEPRWQVHHQYHHRHSHWRHNGGLNWMVPAIIGGAVIYSATRPDPVIVQPPVQVIQTQKQNCSPWTETENSDGTVTRTRTCTQ
jgi:hypothetical protein